MVKESSPAWLMLPLSFDPSCSLIVTRAFLPTRLANTRDNARYDSSFRWGAKQWNQNRTELILSFVLIGSLSFRSLMPLPNQPVLGVFDSSH
jgi:hypothetical protein